MQTLLEQFIQKYGTDSFTFLVAKALTEPENVELRVEVFMAAGDLLAALRQYAEILEVRHISVLN